MAIYTVYSLDVWGNRREGYEVNDRRRAGSFVAPVDLSHDDLFKRLKRAGLIGPRIRRASVEIDWVDDTSIYINDARQNTAGRPVYEIEVERKDGEK